MSDHPATENSVGQPKEHPPTKMARMRKFAKLSRTNRRIWWATYECQVCGKKVDRPLNTMAGSYLECEGSRARKIKLSDWHKPYKENP